MPAPTLAPGARVLVRDEEWIVRCAEKATPGDNAVHVTGLSELVRGRDAIAWTIGASYSIDMATIEGLPQATTGHLATSLAHVIRFESQ